MCSLFYIADDNPLSDHHSSYDSLDKYNYALETLKLTDDHNYFSQQAAPHSMAINSCMLRPKCRQPYIHNSHPDDKLPASLVPPPLPPLPKQQTVVQPPSLSSLPPPEIAPPPPPPLMGIEKSHSTILTSREMEKQQQLSDWYYIKSNPKSPRLPPRPEKRTITTTTTTTNGATASVVVSSRCSPSMQRENSLRNNGSMKKRGGNICNAIGIGGVGNGLDKSNDIIHRRDEIYTESNEQHLNNQTPNKFVHSMCDEKTNGYASPAQSMERKRPMMMHRDQSPIYQQLNQYNKNHMHVINVQHQQQRQHVTGGNVPNYENHQIAPNFHQYQKPPHTSYSPRNRTAANQNQNHNNSRPTHLFSQFAKTNTNYVNSMVQQHQSPAALARFGELTSSSFEHVNVSSCMPDMTSSDKQYRSTSNFTNEPDLIDERRIKVMQIPPHRRAVPPVPVEASPNQTVSLLSYSFY